MGSLFGLFVHLFLQIMVDWGMVIPAELFQVKYASETRVFLSEFFDRITIVTFKKLVFDGIQQEVVLLLCEKSVEEAKGIRVLQLNDLKDLEAVDFKKVSKSEVQKNST